MATTRLTPQLQDQLQFNPKWWWDPVPIYMLDHLSSAAIREIGAIQVQTQINVLDVQKKALEQTLGVLRKVK